MQAVSQEFLLKLSSWKTWGLARDPGLEVLNLQKQRKPWTNSWLWSLERNPNFEVELARMEEVSHNIFVLILTAKEVRHESIVFDFVALQKWRSGAKSSFWSRSSARRRGPPAKLFDKVQKWRKPRTKASFGSCFMMSSSCFVVVLAWFCDYKFLPPSGTSVTGSSIGYYSKLIRGYKWFIGTWQSMIITCVVGGSR